MFSCSNKESWSWIYYTTITNYYSCNLCFQLVIGCQNARKKSPERRILRLSGEEESGHFSGEDELEDSRIHHNNNARGQLMQEKAGNSNSRAGSSSGHSSGHMSHRNEITSGNFIAIYCNMNAIMQRSDIYGHTSISLSFLFRKNFKSLKILIIEKNTIHLGIYLRLKKKLHFYQIRI